MRGMHHAGSHIVSFDMKRLDVRQRTQILDTRQARNKLFVMEYNIIIVLLTLVLTTNDVVSGSLKSKSSGSFSKNGKALCTTCKVIRKVGNHSQAPGTAVTLKCAFRGVHPTNITWRRNGKRLKETKNVVISAWRQNGSKLKIKSLTRKEIGTYVCVGRNNKEQYIRITGYVKFSEVTVKTKKERETTESSKQKTGECQMYEGTICAPYIQDNVRIFVEEGVSKSQRFIEAKLKFGYDYMSQNLSKSCSPVALPLWCHHHFPQCTFVNSKRKTKPICKRECETIESKVCKREYDEKKKAENADQKTSSQSSEDDLFPNCKLLPDQIPYQSKQCVSIKKYVTISPEPPILSGQCKVYNGDVCKMKSGKKVFVKDSMEISAIEKVIKETLEKRGYLSTQCQSYFKPLLCQLHLPDCDESSSIPKGKSICKDECLVLKNKYCKDEYSDPNKFSATSIFFDCSSLPPLTSKSGKCSSLGVRTDNHSIIPATKRPMIGTCQPYRGTICREYLQNKNIFIEDGNRQKNIEIKLKIAMTDIEKFTISPKCDPFVLPLLCHHLFPFCEAHVESLRPSKICRQDCDRIRLDFCPYEYAIAEEEFLTGSILFPSCHVLIESNERCISLQRYFINNRTASIPGDCYRDNGMSYKGFSNTTQSGAACQRWDETGTSHSNLEKNFCRNPRGKRSKPWCFTELGIQLCNIPKCDPSNSPVNGSGENYLGTLNITINGNPCQPWNEHEPERRWAHNYCRNPKGSEETRPWCYVEKGKRESCDVPKVSARKYPESDGGSHLSNLLYTVIPCVVFGLIVAIVIIAICWKRHKQGPDAIKKNTRMTVTVLLPELRTIPGENILLPKFMGNGKFGSMYTGEIHSEDGSHVSRLVKVASNDSREEFINQAKRWSQFHHPNLLIIEAITSGSEPMTLVYEPAGHGSLHQYLIYHSPNNPNFSKDHALLDKAGLLDISRQIAAGMAYLSSHDYVHGELMTRNCQVAHSMVIKITDFTIDRDACYFRRPNKRPIALGWMAPETIQSETYTIHSDVWAFGIVLWEIFTYGFQPYFGFIFPEVREKILNMVLLEQPRDCIPVVYELMRNCWTKNPTHRPQFVDLHEDLNTLCNEYLEEDERDGRYVTEVNL